MGVFSFLQRLLRFYAKDRLSLILFLCSALGLIYILQCSDSQQAVEPIEISAEVKKKLALIDSLKQIKNTPKRYVFNPNFLSEYNAYVWGIGDSALQSLEAFRAGGNWLRSSDDFKQVTGISDSLLTQMEPYFKFPEWAKKSYVTNKKAFDFPEVKRDLNTATLEELQEVYGVGPVLSQRILDFKERYGNYRDSLQLRLVYGLKPATRSELLKHFEVRDTLALTKIDINTASAADLATIPGISFELARDIVIFRRLHEGIESADQLQKVAGISDDKLAGIAVYLQFK